MKMEPFEFEILLKTLYYYYFQIVRMRANFLQPSIHTKLVDDDSKHSLPIGQMGNYQDYLKKMPVPLREIESTPVRQHMFGKNKCHVSVYLRNPV